MRVAIMVCVLAASIAIPTAAHSADGAMSAASMGVTVTSGTGVSLAGPSCPSGDFCVWRYTNPGSDVNRYVWSGSDGDYRNNHWSDGATVDNTPSAIFNNSSHNLNIGFFAGYNYTNTSTHTGPVCLAPGYGLPDLRQIGFDNAGSSHRFTSGWC